MNIQKLGVEVKAEQHRLKELKAKAIGRQVQSQAAKAKARAAKLDYKKVRAAAKKAKKLWMEAEEQVERQRQVLAKAEKRLAKGLRNASGEADLEKPAPAAPALVRKTVQQLPKARRVPAITPNGKSTQRPRPQEASVPLALSSDSPG
jgi:hypothetical protein